MADYASKLTKDLQARLEEVNKALAEYDSLIGERERLEAALEALAEPAAAGSGRD